MNPYGELWRDFHGLPEPLKPSISLIYCRFSSLTRPMKLTPNLIRDDLFSVSFTCSDQCEFSLILGSELMGLCYFQINQTFSSRRDDSK